MVVALFSSHSCHLHASSSPKAQSSSTSTPNAPPLLPEHYELFSLLHVSPKSRQCWTLTPNTEEKQVQPRAVKDSKSSLANIIPWLNMLTRLIRESIVSSDCFGHQTIEVLEVVQLKSSVIVIHIALFVILDASYATSSVPSSPSCSPKEHPLQSANPSADSHSIVPLNHSGCGCHPQTGIFRRLHP